MSKIEMIQLTGCNLTTGAEGKLQPHELHPVFVFSHQIGPMKPLYDGVMTQITILGVNGAGSVLWVTETPDDILAALAGGDDR